MKSYQFFTDDNRGGTMLCDDESLEQAVAELTKRFKGVVKVQIGKQVWQADSSDGPTVDSTSAGTGRGPSNSD